MTGNGTRLRNMETVYSATGAAAERVREWEGWAETPAWVSAVRTLAEDRARRRYLAEVGWDGPLPDHRKWLAPGSPDFDIAIGRYDSPAFVARWRREVTDLARLTETLGAEAGWAAWLREADAWPPRYRGPGTNPNYPTDDQAIFDRILAKEQEMLDRERAGAELAAWRARTGWRANMTAEEKHAFDARLMPGAKT